MPSSQPVSLQSLLSFWHSNYCIEDDVPLLVALATAVSNRMPGEPVWLFLVGPPSTIKTEMIRTFGNEPDSLVYPLSTLTANTFISGLNRKSSLLPKLDGKILTIKDFTTILEKNKDTRNEILSQLREIFDGYFTKATGSEEGAYQNVKCKVTVIAGVTPIIDLYDSVQGLLGDRFLKVRVAAGDARAVSESAMRAAGNEETIRNTLHALTSGFLNGVPINSLQVSASAGERILQLASFTARARTAIARDWRGTILYMPQPEGIARIYKQFLKLARALCLVLGKGEIDDTVLALLTRVAKDTVDQRRTSILSNLYKDPAKTSVVAARVGLPTETTKRLLEDLHILGFAEKSGDENSGYQWAQEGDYDGLLSNNTSKNSFGGGLPFD